MDSKFCMIFVTASNHDEAKVIADALLKDKLAACVNIVDSIKSFFLWKGKLDRTQESLLIIKTKVGKFNKICSKVKTIHSYDVPEIIALPIIEGDNQYLQWIDEEISKS